jgi:hypothetical protein
MFEWIVKSIVIGLITSLMSGFLVWFIIYCKEKKQWQRAKDYIEEDWLELLNKIFYSLELFIVYPMFYQFDESNDLRNYLKVFDYNSGDYLGIQVTKFKEKVLPRFANKYNTKILSYEKEWWSNISTDLRGYFLQTEVLISRLLSFSYADTKMIQRIYNLKNRMIFVIHYCESWSKCKDDSNAALIESFVEFVLEIAEEQLKFSKSKVEVHPA